MKVEPCRVYTTFCEDHECVHGAEAEEIREAVEDLIHKYKVVRTSRLQQLLNDVDARDALAYIEAEVGERRAPTHVETWWLLRNGKGEYLSDHSYVTKERMDAQVYQNKIRAKADKKAFNRELKECDRGVTTKSMKKYSMRLIKVTLRVYQRDQNA